MPRAGSDMQNIYLLAPIPMGIGVVMRLCKTCEHLKRPEIDRRLAAGEPSTRIAHDYALSASSVHRHKTNCLKLASSNAIKKEAAQGSAALALIPSKEDLGEVYAGLLRRIDEIVTQAQQEGSLKTAISGLNTLRQTVDSLVRWNIQSADAKADVAVQNNIRGTINQIIECVLNEFDHEPAIKARLAQA